MTRKAGELKLKEITGTIAFPLLATISPEEGGKLHDVSSQRTRVLSSCSYVIESCPAYHCSTAGIYGELPWLPCTPLTWSPGFSLQTTVGGWSKIHFWFRWRAQDNSRFVYGVLLSLLNGDFKSIIIKWKWAIVFDSWDFGWEVWEAGVSPSCFLPLDNSWLWRSQVYHVVVSSEMWHIHCRWEMPAQLCNHGDCGVPGRRRGEEGDEFSPLASAVLMFACGSFWKSRVLLGGSRTTKDKRVRQEPDT